MPSRPSRFLREIPPRLIQELKAPPAVWQAYDPQTASASWGSGSSAARAKSTRGVRSRSEPAATATRFGDGFDVGQLVRHPDFGSGRILGREGSGPHLKLTIDFTVSGPKKILPAYTRLESVS
jgi:DNA helicase-2/ATP-dependent DNA helicase PcrA